MKAARKLEIGDRRSAINEWNAKRSTPTSALRPPSPGFTLFELLAVITIIGVVLAVTLGSFQGWGDAQAVRGSAELVEAALLNAREYAVSQRAPVRFEYQTLYAPTGTVKRSAEFRVVRELSVASATNLSASASASAIPAENIIGPVQRLPGGAWMLRRVPPTDDSDAYDSLIFLPSGRVTSLHPDVPLRLFVVSRRLRSTDNVPTVLYRIDVDKASGAVTTTKLNPDQPESFER